MVVVDGVHTSKNIRSGTTLPMTDPHPPEHWARLFASVTPAIQATMKAYVATYPGLAALAASERLESTRPTIERVDPGQGFNWHSDHSAARWERVVAALLYLRTIRDGGRTEFMIRGRAVQPEAGKIVLFPPFWTHFHRGAPPVAESKYVLGYFWTYSRK